MENTTTSKYLAVESDATAQLGLVILSGGAEVRVRYLEPSKFDSVINLL